MPPVDGHRFAGSMSAAPLTANLYGVPLSPRARTPGVARACRHEMERCVEAGTSVGMDAHGRDVVLAQEGKTGANPQARRHPQMERHQSAARLRRYTAPPAEASAAPVAPAESGPRLEMGRCLGTGGMAEVYHGRYIEAGEATEVALKVFDRAKMVAHPDQFRRVKREFSLLIDLKHPNILRMYAKISEERRFILVMEFLRMRDCFTLLKNRDLGMRTPACERLTRSIARKLANALIYLHNNNIAHRDLKAENIMVGDDGEVKLIDFGLATKTSPDAKHDTMCGTLGYMSPEMVNVELLYHGFEVDVWSFGVVVYVFLFGRFPFGDPRTATRAEVIRCTMQDEAEYPVCAISRGAVNFLESIFIKDPARRPDIHRVARHPWLAERE